jgi:phage baseplate assembly protein W
VSIISGGGNRTTWTLNTVTPAVLPTPTTPVLPPATQLSFLGFGVLAPLQRGGANDFAAGGGVDLVRSRVRTIIGTKAGVGGRPGEFPWRPDFGSRLTLLRHQSNTAILGRMGQQYVLEALAKWEPCVRVAFATVLTTPSDPRALSLRIVYDIVATNPAGNRVALPQQTVEVPLSAKAS